MNESSVATKSYGSESVTAGVRVRAWPVYVPARSDPESKDFVFSYRIRISNETAAPVTLISRRWIIVNAEGQRHDVEGDGVVGRQPTIQPGQSFEYTSFCQLTTSWGTMEGEYVMRRGKPVDVSADLEPLEVQPVESAELFKISVARFYLVAQRQAEAVASV